MPEEQIHFSPESQFEEPPKEASTFFAWTKLVSVLLIILLGIIGTIYWYLASINQPPENFPVNKPVTIEQGTEVRAITELLEREDVVQSDTFLYYVLVLFYDPTDIKASSYVFETPLTTFEVANRLTQGDFDTDLIRFTHYEGERARHIAERAGEFLPNFDAEEFIIKAEPLEGRLFPDTYFIPVGYTEDELLTLMQTTFEEKVAVFQEQTDASDLTLDEIIILASIIEREANTKESKEIVSGVLQNRLKTGMPLQVDASMEYVLDKPLAELTPEDLELETPYNTYLNKGLPPTPIGNPGLEAIMAVLEPTESEYYYYITGNDGEFYYAKSYREHLKKNIEKHLR